MEEIYHNNQIEKDEAKLEKYNPDNIFSNKQSNNYKDDIEEVSLIETKEEKWYIKIINKIKSFFEKK